MVLRFKIAIASKIAQQILGKTPTRKDLKSDCLYQNIFKCIRVLNIHKGSNVIPQYGINITEIAKNTKVNVELPELKDEGIGIIREADAFYFAVDPTNFTKEVLENVQKEGSKYGYLSVEYPKESVCIEFSSPNIAKPFHVGHLRSTIIGNVVSNLYEAAGYDVKRINFLGDWGTQFGLLALGLQTYSKAQEPESDPLQELLKVYVRINKDVKAECGDKPEYTSSIQQEALSLFHKLEKGDPELKSIWQEVRTLSLTELDKMYQRLGSIRFSHVMSESDFYDKSAEVLQCLRNSSLLKYDSDGVAYVDIGDHKKNGRAVVLKSDGSSLYLTRDIAAALERQKMFPCDRMHYVVENGQRSHFQKLVYILNQLGVPWAKRPIDDIHVRFGRVQGMSTRSGNVVFLQSLLDEARDKVAESMRSTNTTRVSDNMDEVAEAVAVSAIILQDLYAPRVKDYRFSWEKMLSFKTNSGVFAQYCHARLCNMIKGCGIEESCDVDIASIASDVDLHLLVLHMARYPDVFETSLQSLQPHHIANFMYELCHLINRAYKTCQVKGQPLDVAQTRLAVFSGSKQVLANCLQILGVQAVENM